MLRTRWLLSAAVATLVCFMPRSNAVAQTVSVGSRVRVKSTELVAPIIGNFQGMRRDTVVVIEEGGGAHIWTFPGSSVDRLEVSVGMKPGNRGPTAKWAGIGALVGGSLGLITAYTLEASSNQNYNQFLSAIVGAAAGGVIGGIYGYGKLEEHWANAPIPRHIGITPTRDGARLSFSASF